MKNINCRKIGAILAILFLVGLVTSTIYSRSYAERQKPYVHIAVTESRIFAWAWDTEGFAEVAGKEVQEMGFEWVMDVVVPQEAYINYMEEFMMVAGWHVEFIFDRLGWPWHGTIVNRHGMDGDVALTIGFNVQAALEPHVGDRARVFLGFELDFMHMITMTAVHHDPISNLYYIYTVDRRDGMWGREFFVQRQNITIIPPGRVGHLYNIVFPGIDLNLPIVTWSDRPLHDGALVRLWD